MSREIENTIPILGVLNLATSIEFYREVLGFTLDWGGEAGETLCQVSRDGRRIMLSSDTDIGRPSWVWIGLDSDRLFGEVVARGATVRLPPENHFWAYDMQIEDPDGNVLWLGTDPRTEDE